MPRPSDREHGQDLLWERGIAHGPKLCDALVRHIKSYGMSGGKKRRKYMGEASRACRRGDYGNMFWYLDLAGISRKE